MNYIREEYTGRLCELYNDLCRLTNALSAQGPDDIYYLPDWFPQTPTGDYLSSVCTLSEEQLVVDYDSVLFNNGDDEEDDDDTPIRMYVFNINDVFVTFLHFDMYEKENIMGINSISSINEIVEYGTSFKSALEISHMM